MMPMMSTNNNGVAVDGIIAPPPSPLFFVLLLPSLLLPYVRGEASMSTAILAMRYDGGVVVDVNRPLRRRLGDGDIPTTITTTTGKE
jgi:hypothetical protein